MTTERKLLEAPMPTFYSFESDEAGWSLTQLQAYALANMAPLEAEIARLREALQNADNLQETDNGT